MRRHKSKGTIHYVRPAVQEAWRHKALDRLIATHETRFLFYYAKPVNEVLSQARRPSTIQFEQETAFISVGEQMRRFYKLSESEVRLRNYANYYAGIPEYHWVNFPGLDVSPIFYKRKKRFFKTQKRAPQSAELVKSGVPRRSVLKNLDRRTMYLEEIEADVSQAGRVRESEILVEESRIKMDKHNPIFRDAEVHDIFDPEFSSQDEPEDDLKVQLTLHTQPNQPLNGRNLNISVQSKDLFDLDLVKSVCSNIRNTGRHSTDRILDDFSELVSLRNVSFQKSIGERKASQQPDGMIDSHGPAKKTQKKCQPLDPKTQESVETQNVTKGTSTKANTKFGLTQISNSRQSKPFFGTVHNNSRGQGSDRNSVGAVEFKKRPIGLNTGQKSSKKALFSSSSKKIVVNYPLKVSGDSRKGTNGHDLKNCGSQTDSKRDSYGIHDSNQVKDLRSNHLLADNDTARKRNTFVTLQPMVVPTPIKTIKFSLKEKAVGTILPKKKLSEKFSFKKKETTAFLGINKNKSTKKLSRKMLLDFPVTPRTTNDFLNSKAISGFLTDRAVTTPVVSSVAGMTGMGGKWSTSDKAKRPLLKSNLSIKSLVGLKQTKFSYTLTKKVQKNTRGFHIDEYDYYTEERNGLIKDAGKLSRFGKRGPSAGRLTAKTSAENTWSNRQIPTDIMGIIKDKFFGKIAKTKAN